MRVIWISAHKHVDEYPKPSLHVSCCYFTEDLGIFPYLYCATLSHHRLLLLWLQEGCSCSDGCRISWQTMTRADRVTFSFLSQSLATGMEPPGFLLEDGDRMTFPWVTSGQQSRTEDLLAKEREMCVGMATDHISIPL